MLPNNCEARGLHTTMMLPHLTTGVVTSQLVIKAGETVAQILVHLTTFNLQTRDFVSLFSKEGIPLGLKGGGGYVEILNSIVYLIVI